MAVRIICDFSENICSSNYHNTNNDKCEKLIKNDISTFAFVTITKMGKDGAVVSSDVLVKICTALDCTMDDIVEIVLD